MDFTIDRAIDSTNKYQYRNKNDCVCHYKTSVNSFSESIIFRLLTNVCTG